MVGRYYSYLLPKQALATRKGKQQNRESKGMHNSVLTSKLKLLEPTLALFSFLFQGFFTYLYMISIIFLLYVFCFLLHEGTCCGGSPPAPGTVGRNTYFHVSKPKIQSGA